MKDLVNKEQALALKELGFEEDTIFGLNNFDHLVGKLAHGNDGSFISWDRRYDSDLPIPTYSQAFKFFREKYNLDGSMSVDVWNTKKVTWRITGGTKEITDDLYDWESEDFNTYE